MRNRPNTSLHFAWRALPLVFLPAMLLDCFSTTTPTSTPAKNPLDDAPPAEMAAGPASPNDIETKKNKFDDEQAKIMLTRAGTNAHTCVDVVDADQPHGDGVVTVTFAGVGKSTKATIAAPFDGTPMGQCATRAFVNIIVSPFEGPDVDLSYTVNLKPDEKPTKKDAKPKKK